MKRKYTFLSENIMSSNVHQKYKIKKICDLFDVLIHICKILTCTNFENKKKLIKIKKINK